MRVSDQAVQEVAEKLVISRERRREIQKMSAQDLTRYVTEIYRLGFEDGLGEDEVRIDWDDVLALICEVAGPEIAAEVDRKLKEVYQ